MTLRFSLLAACFASAAFLSACGGGGGGGSATTNNGGGDGSSTPQGTKVTLTGIVAKGLTSNADVNVYAVTNGAIGTKPLVAAVTTDSSGHYSLSFTSTTGQNYAVVASAHSDGSTSHLDEVSNAQQALPAGFVVRSLLKADGSTSAVANLTPFSEMAVKVAASASGGVTADNAAQAVSTVSQLLGFNPSNVTPGTVASATAGDQQKLAIMLASVSQLANDSSALAALGCTGSTIVTAGDKTACVVATLAAATQLQSLHLSSTVSGTTTDVSQLLGSAVQTVLANTRINPVVGGNPKVDPTLLTPVLANLACTSNCTAATATASASSTPVATGIAAAKTFFTTMVNDWTQMFSSGGATAGSTGAVNQAAYKITQAISTVLPPSVNTLGELATLAQADTLRRGYASGVIATAYSESLSGQHYGGGYSLCGLYTDTSMTRYIYQPQDAASAVLACVYVEVDSGSVNLPSQGHLIVLQPGQVDGSYTYAAYAVSFTRICFLNNGDPSDSANYACAPGNFQYAQSDNDGNPVAHNGSASATYDGGSGLIGSFTVSGDLPPNFVADGSALTDESQTWSLTSTVTSSGAAQSVALSGEIDSFAPPVAGSVAHVGSVLLINSGHASYPGTAYVGLPSQVTLELDWGIFGDNVSNGALYPTAFIEATLGASDLTLDATGANPQPATVTLVGTIGTVDASVGAINNVVTVNARRTLTGYASYDPTVTNASNFYSQQLQATATVTAPNEPVLEFSIGGANHLPGHDNWGLVTLQYRRLVNSAATQVVSGVATVDPVTGLWTTTLADNVDNLSVTLTKDSSAAPQLLLGGSTVIGTFNTHNSVLTFSDGSFMSLALGL